METRFEPSWPRALGAGYGIGLLGAVLALVLGLVGVLASGALGLSLIPRLVLLLVLGQYVAFIGLALAYLRRRGMTWPDVRAYLGVELPGLRDLAVVVGGFIALLVSVVAISVVIQSLGLQPAPNQSAEAAQQNTQLVPVFVVASILVIGPSEETLFRGVVQNRLREAMPAVAAIPLTAILFAAIHVTALSGGLGARGVTIIVLSVPSLVFGIVYEYTENLAVPALIHGFWNAMLFTAIGLASSEALLLPEL